MLALRAAARALGAAAPVGAVSFRKAMSATSVFSADAEAAPINSDLSSFGETSMSTLLRNKGDTGAWLWCTTQDNVYTAITKMSDANVGSLIVLDSSQTSQAGDAAAIRGIFTERDYMRKVVLAGKNSKETGIVDCMTPEKVMMTVHSDTSVMEAMEMMFDNNIRHLPVLDDGRLVGMVSIRDVVGTLVQEHKKSMELMSSYINGSY